MIKKVFREFYLLSRGDRRAFLLLSMLLILSLLIRITVQLLPGRDPPGMENFIKESRSIMAALARADSLRGSGDRSSEPAVPGFTDRLSGTRLAFQPSLSTPININRADSLQLLPLPGIGPVFAGRIIKYRNLLGGFTAIDQLYEVYGLGEETIGLIRDRVFFDTTAISKIALDSASFRDLLRHPYLQLEDAKALMQFREFKGQIGSWEELRENSLLPDSTMEKMRPYLQFGH